MNADRGCMSGTRRYSLRTPGTKSRDESGSEQEMGDVRITTNLDSYETQ